MLAKYALVITHVLRKLMICAGFLCAFSNISAQEFKFSGANEKQSISFKCIKNLIIIPVFINQKGPFDFVLDTGVGPLIITNPSIIDSINFNLMRKIQLSGLGLETIEAYVTQNITARVGRAINKNIPTAILKEDLFNLSGHLGIKIYGLIGYDFFNSFVVDIRYSQNKIVFQNADNDIKYRGKKIPIKVYRQKPYVDARVELNDSTKINTRLLIDTGASHALSMETLTGGSFPQPDSKIKANLGMSLSGQIKGYLGRINKFSIGGYQFNQVISGFPDYEFISSKIDFTTRNGNLGGEIMRKFDVQFNYREGFMYLKPNSFRKQGFQHDMVGMVVFLDPKEYKRLLVGDVDENSPAEKAGLCPEDEIISINFKPVTFYTLNDITEMFKSRPGRSLIFEVFRDNHTFFKVVRLEKRI